MSCIKHGRIKNIPYTIRDMGSHYVGYLLLNMDIEKYHDFMEISGVDIYDITLNVHRDEKHKWYNYEDLVKEKFDVIYDKINPTEYNTILGIDNNHFHNIELGDRKYEPSIKAQLDLIAEGVENFGE